jgi:hypothetical protein
MVKPNFFIIFLSCEAGCCQGITPLTVPLKHALKNGTLLRQ